LKKYIILIIFLLGSKHFCFANDSTSLYKLNISIGTYGFVFNNDLTTTYSPHSSFIDYEFNPSKYYSLGLGGKYSVTKKKSVYLSFIYSNSTIGYQYSTAKLPQGKLVINGNIRMKAALVNTLIQYKVSKSLFLNYGLGHYFNIVNRFDNDSIAKIINWNNGNSKSNMKSYTISFCLGGEIRVLKKISLEFNYMRGINKFIELYFADDSKSKTIEKLRYVGLTINYKIK